MAWVSIPSARTPETGSTTGLSSRCGDGTSSLHLLKLIASGKCWAARYWRDAWRVRKWAERARRESWSESWDVEALASVRKSVLDLGRGRSEESTIGCGDVASAW